MNVNPFVIAWMTGSPCGKYEYGSNVRTEDSVLSLHLWRISGMRWQLGWKPGVLPWVIIVIKWISIAPISHSRWGRGASVCIEYGASRTSCTGSTLCNIYPVVQSGSRQLIWYTRVCPSEAYGRLSRMLGLFLVVVLFFRFFCLMRKGVPVSCQFL